MKYSDTSNFKKQFKKYFKKQRTLKQDLENFKRIVGSVPLGNGKHFNVLFVDERIRIIKARFFCRSLKGSTMRIVYCFFEHERMIILTHGFIKKSKKADPKHLSKAIRIREEYYAQYRTASNASDRQVGG